MYCPGYEWMWLVFTWPGNYWLVPFIVFSCVQFNFYDWDWAVDCWQLYQLLTFSSTIWLKYQLSVPVNCNFAPFTSEQCCLIQRRWLSQPSQPINQSRDRIAGKLNILRFADGGEGGSLRRGGWREGGGGGIGDNDAVFDPDFVSEIKGTQGLTSCVWSDIVFTISPTLENEMANWRLNCKFVNLLKYVFGKDLRVQWADVKNGWMYTLNWWGF